MLGSPENDRRLPYPEVAELSGVKRKTIKRLIDQATYDLVGLRKNRAPRDRIEKTTLYIDALNTEYQSRS